MRITKKESNIQLLFVYGSLKRGFENERLMFHAKSLGKAKTINKYPLIINTKLRYPFLLNHENVGHNVIGELYEVTMSRISELDSFEGKEYIRSKILVLKNIIHHPKKKGIEEIVEANVYFYKEDIEYTLKDISWSWSKR